jgi:thioredoxin 1
MKHVFLLFVTVLSFAGCSQNEAATLDAESFSAQLAANPDAVLIDVRTPQEFSGGHLANAHNIDWNAPDFLMQVAFIDKKTPVFVYCLSGGRSGSAATEMRKNGYTTVYELTGGLLAWRSAGLPETIGTIPQAKAMSLGDFKELTASGNVLIDFYAPWCAPCKQMEPSLKELTQTYKGSVNIVRINIDEQEQLAKQLNITAIPLLQLYRSGKVAWEHNGLAEKDLLDAKLRECVTN